jgi:hypothetical protein
MSLILLSGSNLRASSGEHARWGCLVTNTHATAGRDIPEVRQSLQAHHVALHAAMRAALEAACEHGQLRPGLDLAAGAETLALLAYGVSLRSRARASRPRAPHHRHARRPDLLGGYGAWAGAGLPVAHDAAGLEPGPTPEVGPAAATAQLDGGVAVSWFKAGVEWRQTEIGRRPEGAGATSEPHG